MTMAELALTIMTFHFIPYLFTPCPTINCHICRAIRIQCLGDLNFAFDSLWQPRDSSQATHEAVSLGKSNVGLSDQCDFLTRKKNSNLPLRTLHECIVNDDE